MQIHPQPMDEHGSGWGLAMPLPTVLSGSSFHESDLETDPDCPLSPVASNQSFITMRGAVLALDPPGNATTVSHPSSFRRVPSEVDGLTTLPLGEFNLREELMHCFISYRVATEGDAGNGMSGLLAEKIRELSMHEDGLRIPEHGFGIWLKTAKQPVPFRNEEAKVFLDRDCLLDGQSWLAGFLQGCIPKPTTFQPPKPKA